MTQNQTVLENNIRTSYYCLVYFRYMVQLIKVAPGAMVKMQRI